MLTSIIVPVFALDRPTVEMACRTLDAFRAPEPHELIVVDNGGAPEAVALRDHADLYVRLLPNKGFAGGANAGCHRARGDVLMVGSADTYPLPGYLGPLRAACLRYNGLATPYEADADGDPVSEEGNVRRGDFFGNLMAMPRAMYEWLGGFDEYRFPLTRADTDFAIRAAKAGFWVGRAPGAYVVQEAKHHARGYMDEKALRAENRRLEALHGAKSFGYWQQQERGDRE